MFVPEGKLDQPLIGGDSWVEWLLKGLGALLLMLISIGIKDIRDKLRRIEELDKMYGVLNERVNNLGAKVRALQNHDRQD